MSTQEHRSAVTFVRRAVVDDWQQMKRIRLRALTEAPMAFASTFDRERAFDNETWRARIETNLAFLAFNGGQVVGTATGYSGPEEDPETMLLVAMYVDPVARGTGCAHRPTRWSRRQSPSARRC